MLLLDLVDTKRTTLFEINTRIQNFGYPSSLKKDKIKNITNDEIRYMCTPTKAIQILTFYKLCPFIFTKIIDTNSDNYRLFKLARKIIIYCFSFELSQLYLNDLSTSIEEFLGEWNTEYKELHGFVPNMHFMTHIVGDIQKFGMPSEYSCLRYEAKHQQFKRISKKKPAYKNHQQTLMNTYSRQLEFQFSEKNYSFLHEPDFKRGSCVSVKGMLLLVDKVHGQNIYGTELNIIRADLKLFCHIVSVSNNKVTSTFDQIDRPSQPFFCFEDAKLCFFKLIRLNIF